MADEGMEFFARCASGFEDVVAGELRQLHCKRVRPLKGGVAFFGDVTCAYRACLWSRVATRVQMVLARVDARDAQELYEGVLSLHWESHVALGATLAVQAHGQNPNLRNTQFTALKVKDAVCDRLRRVRGERPDIDAKDPDFAIDVSLHKTKATLYLNLSGQSLHRRGYRQEGAQTEAPLKETLAAGILLKAGWPELARSGASFADPMCGSGTLAIEAAWMAADVAPGILRGTWGFQGWALHDEKAWANLLDDADERMQVGLEACRNAMLASDVDERAIELAQSNAKRAGVDRLVRFRVADAANFEPPAPARINGASGRMDAPTDERAHQAGASNPPTTLLNEEGLPTQDIASSLGLMAVNPPYGQRLLSQGQLPETYGALAKAVDALPTGWKLAVITPDAGVDTALGQVSDQVISCYNGPIEATLRLYTVAPSNRIELDVVSLSGQERTVAVAERNSEQFAARLRKAAKERSKWARREGISCYRIYDADLPDYSLSVDMYLGAGPEEGLSFVRMAEYAPPAQVDPDRAARRYADARAIVPAVLDVEPERVFSKVRQRERGGGQYRNARGSACVVHTAEFGYTFEVDLNGHLDTGIFLDHRITRQMVGSMVRGKRFLNLFAYTGTASVYAAGGGAAQTVTVDMSHTYLAWAQRNMAENGFAYRRHKFERADVVPWLEQEARFGHAYDLVFCDPPTFSNSKAMGARTWSVQRDHVELLRRIAAVLADDGTIVFSCNLRTFKLDVDALTDMGLCAEDLTEQTIPHDFQRNPKIHHCYLVTKR